MAQQPNKDKTTKPPKRMSEQELVDSWIKEMEEAGLSYDQMIEIFRIAGEMYKKMKKTKNNV